MRREETYTLLKRNKSLHLKGLKVAISFLVSFSLPFHHPTFLFTQTNQQNSKNGIKDKHLALKKLVRPHQIKTRLLRPCPVLFYEGEELATREDVLWQKCGLADFLWVLDIFQEGFGQGKIKIDFLQTNFQKLIQSRNLKHSYCTVSIALLGWGMRLSFGYSIFNIGTFETHSRHIRCEQWSEK